MTRTKKLKNETGEEEFFDEPVASAPKIGFFAKLFAGIGIADALSSSHASHPGHCTGDCANCPPHYGYRYGTMVLWVMVMCMAVSSAVTKATEASNRAIHIGL